MKKILIALTALMLVAVAGKAQTTDKILENNKAFAGAKASKESYHAIYQLDNSDPKIIEKAIRNINNALNDPRIAGKIEIELIAFAGGTEAYMKAGNYENDLKALALKGVIIAQCNNTLRERKISRDQLYDFIAVVPSGNGELIIRESEGWAVIKP